MSSRAAGLQGRKQLTAARPPARSSRYVSNLIGIGLLYVERHLWAYLEDGAHTHGVKAAARCRAVPCRRTGPDIISDTRDRERCRIQELPGNYAPQYVKKT